MMKSVSVAIGIFSAKAVRNSNFWQNEFDSLATVNYDLQLFYS